MQNVATFFLWALAACILRQGSFAKDQSGYICLIEDPKQNQCDSIYLSELIPRLNEVVKAQNKGNTNIRESVNEIKSKLERLEVKMGEVQAKLPQEVHAKVEGQLQGLQEGQTKLEGQQTKMEAKFEDSLLAVKTKLEGQEVVLTKVKDSQAKLEGNLLAVQTNIEIQLQAVLNQLQAISNKIDAVKVGVHAITIHSGFEPIGNRYFHISDDLMNWETAERRCREIGGYLASFRNEEEINAITPKLEEYTNYWLGINDLDNEGHFVSVASHKAAPFLKWRESEPNDRNHEENCVFLSGGTMWDVGCNFNFSFICQTDNET